MRAIAVAAIILAAVLSGYWSVRNHDFVTMDDPDYVTRNAHVQGGLTLENVRWAFTTTAIANWHPLTWLSHMLDWELYGERPAGHHLTNVALHALNALLLLALLRVLLGAEWFWPSAIIALVWAVHPLRVESVAWVSERKDILCAFFGLLSLLAYCWHAQRPSVLRMTAVAIALALGLMCKPMLVTWPFLMLLLDFWPLQRAGAGRLASEIASSRPSRSLGWLALEKVPLFLIVGASCVVTFLVQRAGGTVLSADELPLASRLANAAVACARYLGTTFWPCDLTVFYPYPGQWPAWSVAGAALLLATITLVSAALWKRMPWLLTGWLWFIGLLAPVIGLVQVGTQSMADRYTYLPQIGVVMAVVLTAWRLMAGRVAIFLIIAAAIAWALLLQTQHQVRFWRDSDSLYARALSVTRDNWVIEHHAAARAHERGDRAAEGRHRRRALEIRPDSTLLLASLAEFVLQEGNFQEAIRLFDAALEVDPEDPTLLNNQAWLLATSPNPQLRDARRAEQLATRACERVDRQSLLYPGYLDTLAAAQAADGRFDEALANATTALELARAQGQDDLVRRISLRISRYQASRAAQ